MVFRDGVHQRKYRKSYSPGFCEMGFVKMKAICLESNLQNKGVLGMSRLKRILPRCSLKIGFEARVGDLKSH